MHKTILLWLSLPLFASAQVNRSAKEFASEKVEEYVQEKLFKQQPYKPISFGELKPYKDVRKEIFWIISHSFEIQEAKPAHDKKAMQPRLYNFYFFLDEKMRVKRAETYFVSGGDQ